MQEEKEQKLNYLIPKARKMIVSGRYHCAREIIKELAEKEKVSQHLATEAVYDGHTPEQIKYFLNQLKK